MVAFPVEIYLLYIVIDLKIPLSIRLLDENVMHFDSRLLTLIT